jgi:DNA-binding transcriptional ArsR family regulator
MKSKRKKNQLKRVGKTDSIGKTDRIGNTDRIGKTDRIGNVTKEFEFKRVRGRRGFFDLIKDYIYEKGKVSRDKLLAYFQYTTGASPTSIHQALKVLEDLELIEVIDEGGVAGYYEIYLIPKR